MDDAIIIDFEESIIPAGCRREFREITVRMKGERWRIHRHDPDPFPSRPHAHNLDSGLKVHLGSGELVSDYEKEIRQRFEAQ